MKEVIGYDLARQLYMSFNDGKDTFNVRAARKVFRHYEVIGKRGNPFKSPTTFAAHVDSRRRYREELEKRLKSKENKD